MHPPLRKTCLALFTQRRYRQYRRDDRSNRGLGHADRMARFDRRTFDGIVVFILSMANSAPICSRIAPNSYAQASLNHHEAQHRCGAFHPWLNRYNIRNKGTPDTVMLTPFGTDIWIAKGPILSTAGFKYPTRCAIIRLSDGNLMVWSPVTLTPDLKDAVDALGPVKAIVAPNSFHHLFFQDWALAYPTAKCFAAPRLEKKRDDITFDATLTDAPDVIWTGELAQVILRGNLLTDEVVFFHKASGTVLFTDILQQFDKGWFTGWRAIIARLDLMEGTEPQVPRKFRVAFYGRTAARASLKTILGWPAQQVLMAHGRPVTQDATGFLKRAFAWLNA